MGRIQNVSNEVKSAIQRKSAYVLPNNPTDSGWKANDIKKTLFQPIIDGTNSALAEMDRVIDETNAYLDYIGKGLDSIRNVAGNYYHSSMGLIYTLTSEGFMVSGYEGEDVSLAIPAHIHHDGQYVEVVGIAGEAFKGKAIEHIEIPETVGTIGDSAFASCMKLATVVFKGLSELGSGVFSSTNTVYIVPKEHLDSYKTSLSNYVSIVEKQTIGFDTLLSLSNELKELYEDVEEGKDAVKDIDEKVANAVSLQNQVSENRVDIAKNSNAIALLAEVQYQSGLQVIQPISEPYTARQTANGLNVLNWEDKGSPAKLLTVEGSTVNSLNLFNINKATFRGNTGESSLQFEKTGDSLIFKSVNGGNSYFHTGTNSQGSLDAFALKPNTTYTSLVTVNVAVLDEADNGLAGAGEMSCSLCLQTNYTYDANRVYIVNSYTSKPYSKVGTFTVLTTFTTPEDMNNYQWIATRVGNNVQVTYFNLMIVEGKYTENTMPSYNPYFDGLKSATFAGIKSMGVKLFDDRELIGKTPLSIYEQYPVYKLPFTAGAGMYSAMVKLKDSNDTTPQVCAMTFQDINGNVIKSLLAGEYPANCFNKAFQNTLTESEANNVAFVTFYFNPTPEGGNSEQLYSQEIEYVMLNYGETIADNEPYVENTLAFPETECGLGVTIDFENQKIIKQGKEVTFTGEESFIGEQSSPASWDNNVTVSYVKFNVLHEMDDNYRGDGVSNIPWRGDKDDAVVSSFTNATEQCCKVQNSGIYIIYIGTIDELKAWLKLRYSEGNPVVVAYKTATATEIPFTDEQKAVGNTYTVYNKGSETVLNENASYVEPTLTQEYVTVMDIQETIQETTKETVDTSITRALQGEY